MKKTINIIFVNCLMLLMALSTQNLNAQAPCQLCDDANGDTPALSVNGADGEASGIICVGDDGTNYYLANGTTSTLANGNYTCFSISINDTDPGTLVFDFAAFATTNALSAASTPMMVAAAVDAAAPIGACSSSSAAQDILVNPATCPQGNCQLSACPCSGSNGLTTTLSTPVIGNDPGTLVYIIVDANGVISGTSTDGSFDAAMLALAEGAYNVYAVNYTDTDASTAALAALLASGNLYADVLAEIPATAQVPGTGAACADMVGPQAVTILGEADCDCTPDPVCEVAAMAAAPVCSADGTTYSVTVSWTGLDASVTLTDANATESGDVIGMDANGSTVFTYAAGTDYNIVLADADALCSDAFAGTAPDCSLPSLCDLEACPCTGDNLITYEYSGGDANLVFVLTDAGSTVIVATDAPEAGTTQTTDVSALASGMYDLWAIHYSNIATEPIVGEDAAALDAACYTLAGPITVDVNGAGCGCTCSYDALAATNVLCNDNGTPTDPSDDTYTFDVTITAAGGSTWTDSEGNSGMYGMTVSYGPYNIADGDVTISYTDASNAACMGSATATAPATCSDQDPCAIDAQITLPETCNNNGTDTDDSDDTYSFEVTVTGNGTGWTDSEGNSGVSGDVVSYSFPISGGDVLITYTDDNDALCQVQVQAVAPMTCSDGVACSIDQASAANIVCDDNGTAADSSDDTYTFEITVTATGGSTWTDSEGNSGMYGMTVSYGPYNIADGDVTVTFTDAADALCTSSVTASAPASCSAGTNCVLALFVADNIVCDDNGTPGDASDDTYSFEITPQGATDFTTWTDSEGNAGNYGDIQSYGPYNIADGNTIITFTDAADPSCQRDVVVTPPATCSGGVNCVLALFVADNILCDDNGTPTDPSDDTFTFDITPDGISDFTTWVDSEGNTGNYGDTQAYGPYAIADGEVIVTFTDAADPSCTRDVVITTPATCSNAVCLTSVNASADASALCSGSDLTLSAVADESNTSYEWFNMAGASIGTGASVTVAPSNIDCAPLSMTFTVEATCDDDPSQTASNTVTVMVYPAAITADMVVVTDGGCMAMVEPTADCAAFIDGDSFTADNGNAGSVDLTATYTAGPGCVAPLTVSAAYDCPALCPSLYSAGVSANEVCDGDLVTFTAQLDPATADNAVISIESGTGAVLIAALIDPDGDGVYEGALTLNNTSCGPETSNFVLSATCTEDNSLVGQQSFDVTVYPSSIEQYISVSSDDCSTSVSVDPACAGLISFTTPTSFTANPGDAGTVDFCYEYNSGDTGGCFDATGCVSANYDCPYIPPPCDNDAGILSSAIIFGCAGEFVNSPAVGVQVDANAVLVYVLHDGTLPGGNIYGTSTDGTFTNDGSFPRNIELCISTVAGVAGANGLPDFNDPCTDVSDNCTPVVFLEPVVITATETCLDVGGGYEVSFSISGGGPGYAPAVHTYNVTGDYNNPFAQAGVTYTFGPLADGSQYSIEVTEDGKGCGASYNSDPVQCDKLPIELISYTGEAITAGNLLKWVTATEIDNDYFTLERSTDGVNFTVIDVQSGAGTVSTPQSYEFLDKDAPTGVSYYKLWQTDYDGTTAYVGIVTLTRGESALTITSLLPVPVVDNLEIVFSSNTDATASLTVYDAVGRLMMNKTVATNNGINNVDINVADFAAGVYFLNINQGDRVVTEKFVKE